GGPGRACRSRRPAQRCAAAGPGARAVWCGNSGSLVLLVLLVLLDLAVDVGLVIEVRVVGLVVFFVFFFGDGLILDVSVLGDVIRGSIPVVGSGAFALHVLVLGVIRGSVLIVEGAFPVVGGVFVFDVLVIVDVGFGSIPVIGGVLVLTVIVSGLVLVLGVLVRSDLVSRDGLGHRVTGAGKEPHKHRRGQQQPAPRLHGGEPRQWPGDPDGAQYASCQPRIDEGEHQGSDSGSQVHEDRGTHVAALAHEAVDGGHGDDRRDRQQERPTRDGRVRGGGQDRQRGQLHVGDIEQAEQAKAEVVLPAQQDGC